MKRTTAVTTITAIAGLLTLGLAGPASAATTLTVCASGCDSTTIQGAVNLAAAGDTITVAAGTYTEIVTINKDGLILEGVQAGSDARSRSGAETVVSGGQLRLAADDITIDGFTLTGSLSAPATPAAAIYGSTYSGTQILNNIITNNMFGAQFDNAGPEAALIQNNVFDNNNVNSPTGGTGVFMLGPSSGSTNVSIVDNDFSGHTNTAINIIGHNLLISGNNSVGDATFVVLTDSTDVDITNNSVTDATNGSGIFLGLGNDGVTVTDNVLESDAAPGDDTSAIRISDAFGTGASQNYTITGNQISGGWSHAIRSNAGAYDGILAPRGNQFGMVVTNGETDSAKAIDATGNWWDPALDLSAMPNVITDSPCANLDCLAAAPAGPVLAATGLDSTAPIGAAGGILLLGLLGLFVARRRRLNGDRADA